MIAFISKNNLTGLFCNALNYPDNKFRIILINPFNNKIILFLLLNLMIVEYCHFELNFNFNCIDHPMKIERVIYC